MVSKQIQWHGEIYELNQCFIVSSWSLRFPPLFISLCVSSWVVMEISFTRACQVHSDWHYVTKLFLCVWHSFHLLYPRCNEIIMMTGFLVHMQDSAICTVSDVEMLQEQLYFLYHRLLTFRLWMIPIYRAMTDGWRCRGSGGLASEMFSYLCVRDEWSSPDVLIHSIISFTY